MKNNGYFYKICAMLCQVINDLGAPAIADKMNLKHWTLYKYRDGTLSFPAFRLLELYDSTSDRRVFDAILPEGSLLILPKDLNSQHCIEQSDANSLLADSDAHAELVAALADRTIDPDELERIAFKHERAAEAHLLVSRVARRKLRELDNE